MVNDLGPEADEIEGLVATLFRGRQGVEYVRNPYNLGFVGTCNRAVNELDTSTRDILILNSDAALTSGALDAMLEVLLANEKHGVVCARSNDATIASIPLVQRDAGQHRDVETALAVFQKVHRDLPAWTVAPVAIGFCFLLRRSLVRNHGLFDTVFSPGYDEENDFCLRINALGVSSLIANHAFVSHASSASFKADDLREIKQEHTQELLRRYPFYHDAVSDHQRFGRDAIDNFAVALAREPNTRPSILIDLHHMSLQYNGSVRNALSFLTLLQELASELPADFTLRASSEGVDFFNLRKFGFPVLRNGDDTHVFDVAFALSPIAHTAAILSLNRSALRWMVSHLDIISLRTWHLRSQEWSRKRVVFDSLRYADRVVSISSSTSDDTRAFFPDLDLKAPKLVEIPEGLSVQNFDRKPGDLELRDLSRTTKDVLTSGGFVLVMGNGFLHKQVAVALGALEQLSRPIVSLGHPSAFHSSLPGIHELPTGSLSDELMDYIFEQSALMVFPSSYEGFGLPLAEAAGRGKRIVVFRSAALEETVQVLGISDAVTFFEYFDELCDLVEVELEKPHPRKPTSLRTIRDYNLELIDELIALADEPVDLGKLRERWTHFMAVGEYVEGQARDHDRMSAYLRLTLARRSYRIAEWFVRKASPLRQFARSFRNWVLKLLRND